MDKPPSPKESVNDGTLKGFPERIPLKEFPLLRESLILKEPLKESLKGFPPSPGLEPAQLEIQWVQATPESPRTSALRWQGWFQSFWGLGLKGLGIHMYIYICRNA